MADAGFTPETENGGLGADSDPIHANIPEVRTDGRSDGRNDWR